MEQVIQNEISIHSTCSSNISENLNVCLLVCRHSVKTDLVRCLGRTGDKSRAERHTHARANRRIVFVGIVVVVVVSLFIGPLVNTLSIAINNIIIGSGSRSKKNELFLLLVISLLNIYISGGENKRTQQMRPL